MTFVVRLVRVLLALLAVLVAGAFIMALGSQDAGLVEEVVLLLVAALCVWGLPPSRASLLGIVFVATCPTGTLRPSPCWRAHVELLPLRGERTQVTVRAHAR